MSQLRAGRTTEGALAECLHCGTKFRPTEREQEFCCSGCRYVYHLLHKRGLEDFYKYGEKRMPVGGTVFSEREWKWLRREVEGAEAKADMHGVARLVLRVQGISCAGCVWLIEEVFREQPGAVEAVVDSSAGTVELKWRKGECDLEGFAEGLKRFGYLLGPEGEGSGDDGKRRRMPLRDLTRRMGLCAALAMNAMLFNLPRYLGLEPGDALHGLLDTISFLLATASVAIGGSVFFRRAVGALGRGELHIDLPISLGLGVGYVGSVIAWKFGEYGFTYFDFLSVFTFLMLVGRWLQERAVEGNRRRLLEMRVTPGVVLVLRDGVEKEVAAEELQAGERYWVERNGLVPVRSQLMSKEGVFALQWITGEAEPREYRFGGLVPAGARNVGGESVMFQALEGWRESRLERLMRVEGGSGWRNVGVQRIIRFYLLVVILVGLGGLLYWGLTGGGWLKAMQVMISVWVVSCPCAIGVALPLVDDLAAGRMRKWGVFVRELGLWPRLRRVRAILLDKTGTVTLERLGLRNREVLEGLSLEARGVLLAMVNASLHPVARCLREELMARGMCEEAGDSMGIREFVGRGIEWVRAEGVWRLGKASWALAGGGRADSRAGAVFSLDGVGLAEFWFEEEVRVDAAEQVRGLERAGYEVWLLSGDDPERVRRMGRELGLAEGRALGGLEPEGKAELVRGQWAGCALMLGDGANDSLAFDAALCRGTPAVEGGLLENKADFYLMGNGLQGLGRLMAMARRHGATVRTLFGFTVLYNLVVVGVSLGGWMNPLLAAVVMPASSLVSIGVVYWGMREGAEAWKGVGGLGMGEGGGDWGFSAKSGSGFGGERCFFSTNKTG